MNNEDPVEREIQRRTRRSVLVGGIAGLAGLSGWGWLATRPKEDGLPWPLRRVLRLNESIARSLYSERRGATEFPLDEAVQKVRLNDDIGMPDED